MTDLKRTWGAMGASEVKVQLLLFERLPYFPFGAAAPPSHFATHLRGICACLPLFMNPNSLHTRLLLHQPASSQPKVQNFLNRDLSRYTIAIAVAVLEDETPPSLLPSAILARGRLVCRDSTRLLRC
jgi:hypothetical protein